MLFVIFYLYDATGAKQQKTVGTDSTKYAGNFIYLNSTLQYFSQPEGYVSPDGGSHEYVYQYRDHLDNIRLAYSDVNHGGTITASTEIIEENNYYPFGLKHKGYNDAVSANGNDVAQKRKFNGIELEEIFGWDLYEMPFRQYDATLGRFIGIDALSENYSSISTYQFGENSPIYFADPTGLFSTHTDEDGNVIEVRNDGDLGVYKHSQSDVETGNLSRDRDKAVGVTLYENSFVEGDKIDFNSYTARDWIDTFESNQKALTGILPFGIVRKGLYAINARNGEVFDPKSNLVGGSGRGSQLSEGVFISNRDIGNYAAGAFARINRYDKQDFLLDTGAFQLSGNNLGKFINNKIQLRKEALNHKPTDGSFQRTYGEDGRSNYFIRLGYENIRTLNEFNKNFKKIFYED